MTTPTSRSLQSRRSRWRLRVALLFVGLSLGLLTAEVALRLLGVSFPAPYAIDEHCGSKLQPGFRGVWTQEGYSAFHVNPLGFRDREQAVEKPKGTVRIAVLGDSYIEALQVADDATFARVLEAQLNEQRAVDDPRYEVLSFGIAGWGTAQELLALRHYVWQFDPDVVLLAFLAGNDVRNNSKPLEPVQCRPFFTWDGEQLRLDESFREHPDYVLAQAPATRWKNSVINSSRLVQLVRQLRDARRQNAGVTDSSNDFERGLEAEALIEPTSPAWQQAWELTDRLIAQMAAEVHDRGRHFAAFAIPSGVQVDPDAARRTALATKLKVADLDYAELHLAALATAHQFEFIPLVQALRSYAESEGRHLHGFRNTQLGTGHWNEEGHRQAARACATALRAQMKQSTAR